MNVMRDELEGIGKETIRTRSRCHAGIFLEGLRKPVKALSEKGQYSG